jgi:hypothetical protein
MKRFLKIVIVLSILIGAVYVYEVPYKKKVAVDKFYQYMKKEEGVDKHEYVITNVVRGYKSSNIGTNIFFTLNKTGREFIYSYSPSKGFWLRFVVGEYLGARSEKSIYDE